MAVDAAIMELQGEKGWFHSLRANSGYTDAISVYSCASDRAEAAARAAAAQSPPTADDADAGAPAATAAAAAPTSVLATDVFADAENGMYARVRLLGGKGISAGRFRRPRGLAIVTEDDAPLLVVAEAKRIQVLSLAGEPLQRVDPSARRRAAT